MLSPSPSGTAFIDTALEAYTSRLRDLLETLAIARNQLREVSAYGDALRETLTEVGVVLSQEPPTEGIEAALHRLQWLLRGTAEAQHSLDALVDAHREAVPRLVAQERVSTQVLKSLQATLHAAPDPAAPQPQASATEPKRARTMGRDRTFYVVG